MYIVSPVFTHDFHLASILQKLQRNSKEDQSSRLLSWYCGLSPSISSQDLATPLKKMTLLIRASEAITVGRLIMGLSKFSLETFAADTFYLLKSFCPHVCNKLFRFEIY
jgi:hypothetical protein